ncbi:hypothetical protein [Mesonia aestuariivivens]|uniref:Uncharacterized protein n=1 Tax=Mesonia aestuariivivens TaxID=2796128 RepID=A0ABS6W3D3_9FLAO|nr:hypothetical protein [Mesonia aestuariivivens]MBW2961619.1 hypothetical protein [Mesonia aestuariivivens]
MKKSLHAELISIAHRILQLKNKEDIHELKAITAVLFEKLTVLSFAEKHFDGAQSSIGLQNVKDKIAETQEEKNKVVEESLSSEEVISPNGLEHNTEGIIELNTDILKSILAEMPMDKIQAIKDSARPDGLQYNKETITEPHTEMIKDMVAQMLPEADELDEVMKEINPTPEEKPVENNKSEQNFGVHYDDLPQFEPVQKKDSSKPTPDEERLAAKKEIEEKLKQASEKNTSQPQAEAKPEDLPQEKEALGFQNLFDSYETPAFEPKENSTKKNFGGERKSLNDRLKKGINIGLNDRLAYIKHLFDGNATDYNRVLSQLNTIGNFEEAQQFIQQQIKPDYNNWENKEVYEARFLQAIENKYD